MAFLCDGIGGTTKRLDTKASLQPGKNPFTTPHKLFTWTQKILNIKFNFFTVNEHKQESDILEARHKNRKPITGTLKLHCFVPLSISEAVVKLYSFQSEGRKVSV